MQQNETHPPNAIVLPDLAAFIIEQGGAAHAVSLEEFLAHDLKDDTCAFTWLHMRGGHPDTAANLRACGLDQFVIDALMAEETRPRCTVHEDGVVLNLRGANLDPGAETEDMVSVRLWIENKRIVGVWMRPLLAVRDLFQALERGRAPSSPGDLVAKLSLRLADRAEPKVATLNERIDELEELVLDETSGVQRTPLAEIRRSAIILRRFMLPQRDALTTLEIEDLDWLSDRDRSRIREAAERITRFGEELDAIRDRAQVVHDQIMDRRAETMNRQMLILSVVAAVFLPLGLLTGLLGINVGGIPGADNPWAFAIVCALLVALGALLVWWFKRIGFYR